MKSRPNAPYLWPNHHVEEMRHGIVELMTGFADRAEQIAAHLVAHETGAEAIPYDIDGRQSAVDYHLEWPDGRRGVLEVTLVTEATSIAWQGMAAKEDWRWPSARSWEFRPASANFQYKQTRRAVTRAAQLCDEWLVDAPEELPMSVLAEESEVAGFLADDVGTLRRTPFSAGVTLYPSTRTEFVDSAPDDFSAIVTSWHDQPHMASHIRKVRNAADVSERHLFLVPLDEVLPTRFFTDDFELPVRPPHGFEEVDSLWVWSNYWHRSLVFRDQSWRWLEFPGTPV